MPTATVRLAERERQVLRYLDAHPLASADEVTATLWPPRDGIDYATTGRRVLNGLVGGELARVLRGGYVLTEAGRRALGPQGGN